MSNFDAQVAFDAWREYLKVKSTVAYLVMMQNHPSNRDNLKAVAEIQDNIERLQSEMEIWLSMS
jgi:hypothetical protein